MTGFAPAVEMYTEQTFAPVVHSWPAGAFIEPERSIQSRLETGLDRLLHDIERLEETERWDGLS